MRTAVKEMIDTPARGTLMVVLASMMDVFVRSSSSNDFCEATSGTFGEEELSRNERRRVQVYKADEQEVYVEYR